MSRHELNLRLIANAGKVNLKRLENPAELTNHDWERIGEAQEVLAKADNLFVDDEPTMNIAYIRSRLRSMRRSGNSPALVVVDYLQLMSAGKRVESRQLEVSEFARSLKLMAKEFETPIIVGSQLNRLVEQRANKRPTMSDLRESGSIEQDSNVVILLHREDYHDPESPRAGEIDLIVDKNRSGPRGTAVLSWQGHYARCADMAKPEWSPAGGLS
jgi:replicative DNA helicase